MGRTASMRRNLIEGILALSLLFMIALSTGSMIPYSPLPSEYLWVDASVLHNNSAALEGVNVTTSVFVSSSPVISNSSVRYSVEEGFDIQCPTESPLFAIGSHVIIRGISRIESTGVVEVIESYDHDSTSSLIRSVPGFVIVILALFLVYRFDFRKIGFSPRGETQNA